MYSFARVQEGVLDNFRVSYRWRVPSEVLKKLLPDPQAVEQLFAALEDCTLAVTLPSLDPNQQPDALTRLAIEELNETAGPRPQAPNFGWGDHSRIGGNAAIGPLLELARANAANVSYIGPRRIDEGPQLLRPDKELQADARNLTSVLYYLRSDELPLFRALMETITKAFPEIDERSIQVDTEHGQNQGEPVVWYVGRALPSL